jgi:hypothetical protein
MKRLFQLGMLVTAVSALACSHEPTGPAYHTLFLTDQASYAATLMHSGGGPFMGITVIIHYTNQGDVPIYLERCGGASQPALGEQTIGDDGVPEGQTDMVISACAAGPAVEVAPGDVRTDTFTVAAFSPLPTSARFFYLAHGSCNYMGTCTPLLPEADRVSNPFQIFAAP